MFASCSIFALSYQIGPSVRVKWRNFWRWRTFIMVIEEACPVAQPRSCTLQDVFCGRSTHGSEDKGKNRGQCDGCDVTQGSGPGEVLVSFPRKLLSVWGSVCKLLRFHGHGKSVDVKEMRNAFTDGLHQCNNHWRVTITHSFSIAIYKTVRYQLTKGLDQRLNPKGEAQAHFGVAMCRFWSQPAEELPRSSITR